MQIYKNILQNFYNNKLNYIYIIIVIIHKLFAFNKLIQNKLQYKISWRHLAAIQ